jgi:hypothetical protein
MAPTPSFALRLCIQACCVAVSCQTLLTLDKGFSPVRRLLNGRTPVTHLTHGLDNRRSDAEEIRRKWAGSRGA